MFLNTTTFYARHLLVILTAVNRNHESTLPICVLYSFIVLTAVINGDRNAHV